MKNQTSSISTSSHQDLLKFISQSKLPQAISTTTSITGKQPFSPVSQKERVKPLSGFLLNQYTTTTTATHTQNEFQDQTAMSSKFTQSSHYLKSKTNQNTLGFPSESFQFQSIQGDDRVDHKKSQVINNKLSPIELQRIQEKVIVEGVIKTKIENNKAKLRKFVKQGIQGNNQKQEVKREISPLVIQRAYDYNPSKTMRSQTTSSSGSRPSHQGYTNNHRNHFVKTVYTSLSPVRSQNKNKQLNKFDSNQQNIISHRSLSNKQRNPININQLARNPQQLKSAHTLSSQESQQINNTNPFNEQENIDYNIMSVGSQHNSITPIRISNLNFKNQQALMSTNCFSSQDQQESSKQDLNYVVQEIERLKIMHNEEIGVLKRKLVDTEKRFVLLWEHVKENGRRNDQRITEIQQKMNHQSLIKLHKKASPLNNPSIISSEQKRSMERGQMILFSDDKQQTKSLFNIADLNSPQQLQQQNNNQQKSRNNMMNNSLVTPHQSNSSQKKSYQRMHQELQDSLMSIQTQNYHPFMSSQDQQSSTSPIYPNANTKSNADLLSSCFSKNGMFQSVANPHQNSTPHLEIEEEIRQMNQGSNQPLISQPSTQKQQFLSKNFSMSSIKYSKQSQNNTMNSFTPIQTQENPIPNNVDQTRNSNLTINTSNTRSAYPLVSANRINYNSTNSESQSQHSRQNTLMDYKRSEIRINNHASNNLIDKNHSNQKQDCNKRRSLNRVLSMQILNNNGLQGGNHLYGSFDQNFPVLARLEQQYLKNLQTLGNYPSRSPTSNASSLEQESQFGNVQVYSPEDSNNQKLYIISSRWFINWFQAYSANKFFLPQKITNIDAMDLEKMTIKPKAIPNLDYFIINFEIWSSLMNLYGADYEIQLSKFSISIIDLGQDDTTPRHSSFLDVPNELSFYHDNLTAILNSVKFSTLQQLPHTTRTRPLSDDMTLQQQEMLQQQYKELNDIKLQNENLKYQQYQQQREESLKRDITKKNNIIYMNK
ncbi:UNKNOWN [Stylonychia lemnae]|uniref:DUSP domain-containing protein n=1 Tax=Stylonychia lemnae TaxID=5949 RepID=A0A078ARI3_STYLE|nr:UNKNOWN [Stylonychia lemnae]|eukprot:CDW84819.1 UNKNOWN [Stylonychia lemnae]